MLCVCVYFQAPGAAAICEHIVVFLVQLSEKDKNDFWIMLPPSRFSLDFYESNLSQRSW